MNQYNTDPTNPDSDCDGVNDGDEVENGSDPNDPTDPDPAGFDPACSIGA